MGPSDYNFAAISQQLINQGAMQQPTRDQLTTCLRQLLERPDLRAEMGINGEKVVMENQGAVARLTELVTERLHR